MDGDYILVGMPGQDSTGMVYVFHYEGGQWVEQDSFSAADADSGDRFGNTVALSGNRALIGAPYHDHPAENTGTAYVFRREGSEWVQEQKLTPTNAGEGDLIGFRLAVSGNSVLLGDNDNDDLATDSGAVYFFERLGQTWSERPLLRPRVLEAGDAFGSAVVLANGYALVSSPGDDHLERTGGAVYSFALTAPCRSLNDYATLQLCFTGESGLVPAGCEAVDIEPDGDIDLDDYVRFLETFAGP